MNDLIKTFAPPLIEALTPLLLLALTTAGTMLMNALRKKFDNEAAHSLLDHVERAANMAVKELEQTMLPEIRRALADDGRIDSEEAFHIRNTALVIAKRILGDKHPATDVVINSAIEAAVHNLRKS